jgi:hypothetical protein
MSSSAELPATVGLGDADVAVYITKFTNEGTDGGRVVLYDRAGPVSMVTNTGIMHPGLIWDDAGLFFVDQKTDFQVSDRVERNTRSRTADLLVGMQAGANGRRVVLFNDGVFEGKNHTGVGVYSGAREQSQQTLLDSLAGTFSSCGGGVYSVGPKSVLGDWSQLVLLDPHGGGSPMRVGELQSGVVLGSANAPCLDGATVSLWRASDSSSATAIELWRWDTSAGLVHQTKLVGSSGAFEIDGSTMTSDSGTVSWIDNEDLVWIDRKGSAWRSNLKTGLTVKVRDGLAVTQGPTDGWVKSGDWVIQFEYSPDHSSAHLLVYSAKDLSLVETRELPRLAELSPGDQMVLAVAVRPGFTPGK